MVQIFLFYRRQPWGLKDLSSEPTCGPEEYTLMFQGSSPKNHLSFSMMEKNHLLVTYETRETDRWLRTLAAFAENPSSGLNTHRAHHVLELQVQEI